MMQFRWCGSTDALSGRGLNFILATGVPMKVQGRAGFTSLAISGDKELRGIGGVRSPKSYFHNQVMVDQAM